MKPSRFHAPSPRRHIVDMSPEPRQPNDIVLLEDNDLYRYHNKNAGAMYVQDAGPAVSENGSAGFGGRYPAHPASGRPTAPTASSYQASERSGGGGHYVRHATPLGPPGSVRKHSFTTSVETIPINHGALRPGGSVDLFTSQYIGLLLNFMIVGFLNSAIPAIVYPFLGYYLNYSDFQLEAAVALLNFPWYFKFLCGFISDCFPIRRQRRKPYILIGWTVFMVFMFGMMFIQQPAPYKKGEHEDTGSDGAKYVVPLMIGSFAHLLATVAGEGMMIEFAQREGEFMRGKTQCLCIIFRFSGEFMGTMSTSLALYSAEYGGEFAGAVPLPIIFGFCGVVSFAGVVVTKYFLHEEPVPSSSQRLSTQMRCVWSIMQQRTTWMITCFGFLQKLSVAYNVVEMGKMYRYWMESSTLGSNLGDAVSNVGFIIAAFVMMKFLLNTNWRQILVWCVFAFIVVSAPVDMMTVFNVVRDPVFYLAKGQIAGVFEAMLYLLRIMVIIEIADPGYEATTYGIITTVYNLGTTVVAMLKNVVATTFDEEDMDVKADTSRVRWHIASEFLFKYGLRLGMLVLTYQLLPRQKRHTKERKVQGNPTIGIPIALFVLFAGLFVAAMTSNMLSMYESTACLIFAGGSGCDEA